MTAAQLTSLYDPMHSAYDTSQIAATSRPLGYVQITDHSPRRGGKDEAGSGKRTRQFAGARTAEDVRYREHGGIERVDSAVKDSTAVPSSACTEMPSYLPPDFRVAGADGAADASRHAPPNGATRIDCMGPASAAGETRQGGNGNVLNSRKRLHAALRQPIVLQEAPQYMSPGAAS